MNDGVVVSDGPLPSGADPVRLGKTPFFEAVHAERYRRQELIREIQTANGGTSLICYVAGRHARIDREDIIGFVDLLHNIPFGRPVDLLLESGGGDVNAAEKLVNLIRNRTGAASLRVIVPNAAKSAGTLVALGADRIIMSDTSELGPIDPQVVRTDGNGVSHWQSVLSYLDAYKTHTAALARDPNDVVANAMLNKMDPEVVQYYTTQVARAREVAERHLRRGMMLQSGAWTMTAAALVDGARFKSHGQPISWEDAVDSAIGLTVDYLEPHNPLWLQYWRLYCLQALAVKDHSKLFESEVVSLVIDGSRV